MPAPDLNSADGRQGYRSELKGVARGWRWSGLAVLALSLIALFAPAMGWWADRSHMIAYSLVAIGWALLAVAIVRRTRYHKRRLAGWDGPTQDG